MKVLRVALATIFYILTALICLGVAFSPVAASWWAVSRSASASGGRIRWCLVVKRPVVRGLKLTEQHVDWTIQRVNNSDQFIADVKSAVGRYALTDLKKDELLKAEHLSEFAPSEAPDGGAALPVEVKTEHAGGLKPGMRLAFVQEHENKRAIIPAGLEDQTVGSGFELLSITTASKDASIVMLTIAVTKSDLVYARELASGQWRPVILSNPKG